MNRLSLDLFNFRWKCAIVKQICLRILINFDFEYLIIARDDVSIRLVIVKASALDSFQRNGLIDCFVFLGLLLQDYLVIYLLAMIV